MNIINVEKAVGEMGKEMTFDPTKRKHAQEIGEVFEKRVKKDLEKKHRFEIKKRENRSHDCIAIKKGKKYYVECKAGYKAFFTESELNCFFKTIKKGDIYRTAIRTKTNKIRYKDYKLKK